MAKIPDCKRCYFYAHNRHLVCAIHPSGTTSDSCSDFTLDPEYPHRRFVYLLGLQQQTEELLNLFDTHPKLTGFCPACGAEIERDYRAVVYLDCECGWIDGTI